MTWDRSIFSAHRIIGDALCFTTAAHMRRGAHIMNSRRRANAFLSLNDVRAAGVGSVRQSRGARACDLVRAWAAAVSASLARASNLKAIVARDAFAQTSAWAQKQRRVFRIFATRIISGSRA